MSEATISTALGDRRRALRWLLVGPVLITLAFAVIAGAWLVHRLDPNTPHGNPDPGGRRLAYLEETARAGVPAGASVVSLQIQRYAWDPGGCDGGAAGWARASVDLKFRGGDSAGIDAAMAGRHWKRFLPQGGDALRDYVLESDNPYDADATLFSDTFTWDLELTAPAAEVPTHSC